MRRNLAFRLPVAGAHDGAAYQRKLGETTREGHYSARMKSLTATLVAIHHTNRHSVRSTYHGVGGASFFTPHAHRHDHRVHEGHAQCLRARWGMCCCGVWGLLGCMGVTSRLSHTAQTMSSRLSTHLSRCWMSGSCCSPMKCLT